MGWLGAAVFPVVLGAALDAYWTGEMVNGTRVYSALGYRIAFAIAVAAGLLATLCALLLYLRVRRQRTADGVEPAAESPTD
jgi:MFS family permease